ncbi:MAG: GNAT family N-acetyltransferase [Clostridia bacterium]|nr:GNAT family N-acetyltransferase [Clostridia bacterium]
MLTQLTIPQIREIYNKYMVVDFPPDELKPLAHIEGMVARGICTCYALFEDGKVLSYVNLCEKDGFILVDYLAVNPCLRGQGIGSRTLALLKELCRGRTILIECEAAGLAKTEDEAEIRRRRIEFYIRAGFKLSGVSSLLFGVNYVILSYPAADKTTAADGLATVYLEMLGKESFAKNLTVFKE